MKGEMGFYRGPFGGDDAIDARVAQRGIGHDLMTAQDAIEFGAEALDATTALMIEKMRTKFHGDAIKSLKSMREQQEFAIGIERGALHALAIPGGTNFDTSVGGVDIHVASHTDRATGDGIENRERKHGTF